MTAPSRPATWGEIKRFLRIDGWSEDRSTNHEFYERVLVDGTVLQTHVSFGADSAAPGANRFALIRRTQLQVSRADFWTALQSGKPPERPSDPTEPQPPSKAAWIVHGLLTHGWTQQQVDELDEDAARAELERLWGASPP